MNDGSSIIELAGQIRQRKISAVEVAKRSLRRIEELNGALNAFREVYADHALDAAMQIDKRIAAGEDAGVLAGIPIAIKDNIVTDFGHTTCCSRILENYRSPFNATTVTRLTNAGAIIIGKTNCDEFAMGSSTENSAFGLTKNPWDASRVAGGSSGGSAAAVATEMVLGALGSETGGSIRQPASLCGVVGIKPSYGRVSRYGLVAFGSSLDQVGPFARNVPDTALLLRIIAGPDRSDSTCSGEPVPNYVDAIEQPIDNLRIGVPKRYLSDDNDPVVNEAIRNAIATFQNLGASIIDIDLPLTDYGIATYYVLATAEASSNLARYDGIRYGNRAKLQPGEDLFDLYAKTRAEGFGPEVQRRIMLGTYALSAGYYDAYYKRALQVRRLIKREYDRAFSQCHALLGPTSPTPAFPIGSKADPLAMYLSDIYTVNTNIAGICGISLPCGMASVGDKSLPIGLHLQCQAFDESTMFRIARMFEVNSSFKARLPAQTKS
jgi:aspartyl-tRNA(Asn)/glutamyl-tRNA(Gln) amidotransferase subunit A